ncbi:ribosome small subunit-dependent GTPase A [Roseisolibacter sp. H3M3-2]|uniref:ribosome small subunit-dependent GTPase A n=1 Tax=Roseisolibacter sp. H3M3-2 TaxID=3031323 RepID=UPI0023DACBC5|nr:ribosome small subunit-dependent GTPase A [Roseisolibacter sp. H3M3-2]MDF1501757.1 ribosome small subunit-dependent GTPase A [Roseisolibacter sp. H3M3-2]
MTANDCTFRVAAEHRDRYLLLELGAPTAPLRPAVLAGRLRRSADPDDRPVVGDVVDIEAEGPDGVARITAVGARRSLLRRGAADRTSRGQPLAANVDAVLVVVPLDRAPNPRRVEREVTLAWESGATPVVVLTKADLCPDVAAAESGVRLAAPGVEVVAVATLRDDVASVMAPWLGSGATVVLLGPSGAGKSTIANRLLGLDRQRTGGLREDGAGRHTTTHRELLALPGGAWLIDTPGLRALAMWSAGTADDGDALRHTFADVATLAYECRFADCTHRSEPGCAVAAAVAAGALPADRLDSWRTLRAELAWQGARHDAAARAERRAGERAGARSLRRRVREKRGG